MDNAELIHYGVKCMKWGVRRTPVQLGHRRKPKKIAKRSRESPESEKKKSAPKKSVHELSDEELRQAIGRLEMD